MATEGWGEIKKNNKHGLMEHQDFHLNHKLPAIGLQIKHPNIFQVL